MRQLFSKTFFSDRFSRNIISDRARDICDSNFVPKNIRRVAIWAVAHFSNMCHTRSSSEMKRYWSYKNNWRGARFQIITWTNSNINREETLRDSIVITIWNGIKFNSRLSFWIKVIVNSRNIWALKMERNKTVKLCV